VRALAQFVLPYALFSECTPSFYSLQFHAWHFTTYGTLPNSPYNPLSSTAFHERLQDFRVNTVKVDETGRDTFTTWQESIGYVHGDLKYVTIEFEGTLKIFRPQKVKTDVKGVILQLEDKISKYMPSSMGRISHVGDISWTWTATEKGLVDGLFLGMSICFPVAFVVLALATRNIVVAFYAIISIGGIVVTVLGFCKAQMNWGLGIGESVAGIIVIGFSVDYVVHLGHMLLEADELGLKWAMIAHCFAQCRTLAHAQFVLPFL
jgi:hypothetical protein